MSARPWVTLAATAVLCAGAAAAEGPVTEAVPAAAPAEADVPALVVTGYLDTSYETLSGTGSFDSGVADRVFDTHRDEFSLQQAAVNVAYQPKAGLGGVVNVTAGDDARVIRSFGAPGGAARVDLTQAFLQYASSGFTVMAGKFVTLAGAEVITSPADTNFSRSILFGYAIPFSHTGLRSQYAPNDRFSFYAGVNQGWDALKDTNSGKTLEVGVGFTPSKAVSILGSGYFGEERQGGLVDEGPQGMRDLIDIVATWAVSEQLGLVLNYDWGRQANAGMPATGGNTSATWSGLAGYMNYTFNEHWRSSLRAEYLDDAQGYRTGVPQTWRELTTTVAYLPIKRIELRGELRFDASDAKAFQTSTGDASKNQQSVALQALFKY